MHNVIQHSLQSSNTPVVPRLPLAADFVCWGSVESGKGQTGFLALAVATWPTPAVLAS